MNTITQDGLFHPSFLRWLENQNNSVFLETTRQTNSEFRSYLFIAPKNIIQCHAIDQVEACLDEIQKMLKQDYFVAGYFSYEAGYAFESFFEQPVVSDLPLLWFGVYAQPSIFNHKLSSFEQGNEFTTNAWYETYSESDFVALAELTNLTPNLALPDYQNAIKQIKQYITAGDTYQTNFTFKLDFEYSGSPAELYCSLRNQQRVGYSAFITLENFNILSFSPELFFRIEDHTITLKPMKGTAKRGRTLREDEDYQGWLKKSEKNRAENLMIVDLLRNDVGRIAQTGSVKVPHFFQIEKYETIHQATSTITAALPSNYNIKSLIKSLIPSGSVTGAPKLKTMQLIQQLEKEPRGVYTGSIGFFSPQGNAVFNVAIRTMTLNRDDKKGEMGIGSGIVTDLISKQNTTNVF